MVGDSVIYIMIEDINGVTLQHQMNDMRNLGFSLQRNSVFLSNFALTDSEVISIARMWFTLYEKS